MSGDEYLLRRALAELDDSGSVHYRDSLGPAMYQVAPTWATAILCARCSYVAIIPSLPRAFTFLHTCSSCGARIRLAPPAEVLEAAPAPVVGSDPAGRPGLA